MYNTDNYRVELLTEEDFTKLAGIGCELENGSIPHNYKVVNNHNECVEFLSSNAPSAISVCQKLDDAYEEFIGNPKAEPVEGVASLN